MELYNSFYSRHPTVVAPYANFPSLRPVNAPIIHANGQVQKAVDLLLNVKNTDSKDEVEQSEFQTEN